MNISDDWPDFVQDRCRLAQDMITSAGFSESDMEALILAHYDDLTNSSWLAENLSKFPSAHVISLVKVVRIGTLIIAALPEEDEDKNRKLAYLFGEAMVYVGTFLSLPDIGAEFAEKPSGIWGLAQATTSLAKKEVYRAMRQAEGNARASAEKKVKIDKRNAQLCQTAQRLRAEINTADHNLASMTWKTWCNKGYWERFGYKEISDKQVRKILREGGVLPPAKTKKGK